VGPIEANWESEGNAPVLNHGSRGVVHLIGERMGRNEGLLPFSRAAAARRARRPSVGHTDYRMGTGLMPGEGTSESPATTAKESRLVWVTSLTRTEGVRSTTDLEVKVGRSTRVVSSAEWKRMTRVDAPAACQGVRLS